MFRLLLISALLAATTTLAHAGELTAAQQESVLTEATDAYARDDAWTTGAWTTGAWSTGAWSTRHGTDDAGRTGRFAGSASAASFGRIHGRTIHQWTTGGSSYGG